MIRQSLDEVYGTIDTTGTMSWRRRFMLFIGPAFMVCVGYMDPGNWATDIAGGSRYGYQLLWVLLLSNLLALLLQGLSARLGIVRGRDLAQASREAYPSWINIPLYILAEIAIAACDLAEVMGMAIGLNLLFHLPLLWGVSIAVLDTFLILYLQRKGIRYMEIVIFSLVSVIGFAFFVELLFAKPDMSAMAVGFMPTALNGGALYIAIGIIGATVMPHNLYLHSSLVQTRRNGVDAVSIARAIRYNMYDSAIALNLAFFVNASILTVSAAVFFTHGYHAIVEIQDAYRLLEPLMGKALAPTLFAIALIASGQSSTITGTLAGQIVMEGYIDLRIAPWLRRLITRLIAVVPAWIVIFLYGENSAGDLLILSQVILSLQLGFAVIPLIHFVSDRHKMGEFAIKPFVKLLAWASAVLIIGLNIRLIVDTINGWYSTYPAYTALLNGIALPIVGLSLLLLMAATVYPWWARREAATQLPHGAAPTIGVIVPQQYHRIGICIDFSSSDTKAITHGISQGQGDTHYHIIHVVESALARASGAETRDYETLEDWRNLQAICDRLREMGYQVTAQIGFGQPTTIIPQLVEREQIDMLVIGSHGHVGLQDIIFGETIRTVRHRVKCPVLIV